MGRKEPEARHGKSGIFYRNCINHTFHNYKSLSMTTPNGRAWPQSTTSGTSSPHQWSIILNNKGEALMTKAGVQGSGTKLTAEQLKAMKLAPLTHPAKQWVFKMSKKNHKDGKLGEWQSTSYYTHPAQMVKVYENSAVIDTVKAENAKGSAELILYCQTEKGAIIRLQCPASSYGFWINLSKECRNLNLMPDFTLIAQANEDAGGGFEPDFHWIFERCPDWQLSGQAEQTIEAATAKVAAYFHKKFDWPAVEPEPETADDQERAEFLKSDPVGEEQPGKQ